MCVPLSQIPSHLPSHLIPLGCPRALALGGLLHTPTLHLSSISHVVIYTFQCYSLKSSHPCLLPQSPKVCSLHLYLFCCLAYRVIVTISLISLYLCICVNIQYLSLFLTYFPLYNRLQFHPTH